MNIDIFDIFVNMFEKKEVERTTSSRSVEQKQKYNGEMRELRN